MPKLIGRVDRGLGMRRELYVVSVLVAVSFSTAYAKITIRQAEYVGGMLLVQGETARTGQKVTLEGRYSTRTDRNRRFRFRARYLPLDCLAEVRAGLELYLISIANCERR
jgi:hypothetical protein